MCNALIQPHFSCGCSSWCPLSKENLKLKLQKAQNKCIRVCLNLPPRSHIDSLHFRKINWLPVSDRVEYCIANAISECIGSTGMELNQDIPMKCLLIHSADIAQDHRWHSTYLCGKQIQDKKTYPS